MAPHTHLYRRQSVYWWRRRVPKQLRPLFSLAEIRVSTRAHMVQEAAARGARLRVVTDLVFEELERAVTTGVSLPEQTFDQLVNQLVRDELDRCERARAGGAAQRGRYPAGRARSSAPARPAAAGAAL